MPLLQVSFFLHFLFLSSETVAITHFDPCTLIAAKTWNLKYQESVLPHKKKFLPEMSSFRSKDFLSYVGFYTERKTFNCETNFVSFQLINLLHIFLDICESFCLFVAIQFLARCHNDKVKPLCVTYPVA